LGVFTAPILLAHRVRAGQTRAGKPRPPSGPMVALALRSAPAYSEPRRHPPTVTTEEMSPVGVSRHRAPGPAIPGQTRLLTGSGRAVRPLAGLALAATLALTGCTSSGYPADPDGTYDRVTGGTLQVGVV